jgi:hypothetical protein
VDHEHWEGIERQKDKRNKNNERKKGISIFTKLSALGGGVGENAAFAERDKNELAKVGRDTPRCFNCEEHEEIIAPGLQEP